MLRRAYISELVLCSEPCRANCDLLRRVDSAERWDFARSHFPPPNKLRSFRHPGVVTYPTPTRQSTPYACAPTVLKNNLHSLRSQPHAQEHDSRAFPERPNPQLLSSQIQGTRALPFRPSRGTRYAIAFAPRTTRAFSRYVVSASLQPDPLEMQERIACHPCGGCDVGTRTRIPRLNSVLILAPVSALRLCNEPQTARVSRFNAGDPKRADCRLHRRVGRLSLDTPLYDNAL